jgi:hypothetical protein
MAEVNYEGALLLRDVAASLERKSQAKLFIDLMQSRHDIFDDMVNVACNEGRSHVVTFRTGLPKATWTRLYGGVESSKGSEAMARITVAELESKMELDKRILDRYPTEVNSRIQREVASHCDAIVLNYVKAMMYGSKKINPDSFNGLATIYNDAGGTNPSEIAYNVISAGGSASDSLGSIFLVGHGAEGFSNLYPQGHKSAGVDVGTMKEAFVSEAGHPTKTYEAMVQTFCMSGAPFVADWRKCGRICNFKRNVTATGDDLKTEANKFFDILGRLTTRVDDKGVRQNLYMDKGVLEQIKVYASAITRANAVKEEDLNGHKVTTLNGIPVRINDAQFVDEEYIG